MRNARVNNSQCGEHVSPWGRLVNYRRAPTPCNFNSPRPTKKDVSEGPIRGFDACTCERRDARLIDIKYRRTRQWTRLRDNSHETPTAPRC